MQTLLMKTFLGGLAAPAAAQMVDAHATLSAWTLQQRENCLNDRLHASRDDGGEFGRLDHEMERIRDAENRLRGAHDGQLTDNETIALEGRLDAVADQILWMHEN